MKQYSSATLGELILKKHAIVLQQIISTFHMAFTSLQWLPRSYPQ